jgi:hypothetical protein
MHRIRARHVWCAWKSLLLDPEPTAQEYDVSECSLDEFLGFLIMCVGYDAFRTNPHKLENLIVVLELVWEFIHSNLKSIQETQNAGFLIQSCLRLSERAVELSTKTVNPLMSFSIKSKAAKVLREISALSMFKQVVFSHFEQERNCSSFSIYIFLEVTSLLGKNSSFEQQESRSFWKAFVSLLIISVDSGTMYFFSQLWELRIIGV